MKRKAFIVLAISLMLVGFASVSTSLYLNGKTGIIGNTKDFDVYFSKAYENENEATSLIQDKTHIVFTANLSKVEEKYVLDYEVTNGSKNYDVNFNVSYVGETSEYVNIQNNINVATTLKARETRKGRIVITLIKATLEEKEIQVRFELTGNAQERDTLGGEELTNETVDYLVQAEEYTHDDIECDDWYDNDVVAQSKYIGTTYLGHTIDRTKIESITFMSSKQVPSNALEFWDVSNSGNGSIMAYTLDEDENNYFELYIGQDGGVVANPNSAFLFLFLDHLKSIKNIENFNTSNVLYMVGMFYFCRSIEDLDLRYFDTSNCEIFLAMFRYCSHLKHLNVSSFKTNKVESMSVMFDYCVELEELDLSHFDTSSVTDLSGMFNFCYKLRSVNLSSFNTSKVTNMSAMFDECHNIGSLDLSHFDTSNVTDMSNMFTRCKKIITTLTIKGTNCQNYDNIFFAAATSDEANITLNYTEDASSLVDAMIATKYASSNILKGQQVT